MVEVKQGYKVTEVGVIPEDWDLRYLNDIAKFSNGKAHEQYIDDNGDFILVNSKFISTEGRVFKTSFSALSPLSVHEIAMVMSDIPNGKALAKCFLVKEANKYTLNQRICSIKSDDCKNDFLFWILNRNKYFLAFDSGTGQTNLRKQDILGCPIALPPLPEQQAIAQALSDVDSLINSLEKLISKKRDIKTATMQQLLTGKKRLPSFGEGNGYKDTEIGMIPEDWEVKRLGDVLKIRHGKSQHDVVEPYGNFPILGTGGEIGRSRTPLYSKPSVLIGRKGTIDVPRYMDTPFWTVDTLFYSEISDKSNAKFIYYKFLLIDWYSYNEASGVPSLNASTIEKIKASFPTTIHEQQTIAQVLSDMDTEITQLKTRLEKTNAIKQGMMQELLTGRTRLV